MLTQCPSCQTVFRVTGTILKMGHGQVRCGSCRTQFDALECLLDDEDEEVPARDGTPSASHTSDTTQLSAQSASQSDAQADAQSETPSDPLSDDDSIEAREPQFAEDVTLEGSNIEISGVYRIPPEEAPDNTKQVVHEHVVIERNAAPDTHHEDFEIDLSTQQPAVEQVLDPAQDDGEPVASAAGHLLDDVDASGAHQSLAQRRRARQRGANPVHSKIAAELDELTFGTADAVQKPAAHTRLWITASVVLLLALLLQVVHHHRDALVRHPKLGPSVTRLYHSLGLTLQPQWELQAYELQQWGVLSDPAAPDTLRVRASVTNRAVFAQPYPLIKLALQDRWGAPVGVRAFEPNEYLPADAAGRLLAPKQRANAEIVIVDPGADAVGFQLHACLQYPQAMVCTDDMRGVE